MRDRLRRWGWRGFAVAAIAAGAIWAAARAGLVRTGGVPGPQLTAFASANEMGARFAVDAHADTRWDTGAVQAGGEWLLLDLGKVYDLLAVTLDSSGSPGDFARGVRLEGSTDGSSFATLASFAEAPKTAVQVFSIVARARVRWIRITQTGHADENYWSVHEARVEVRDPDPPPSPALRWSRFLGYFLAYLAVVGVGACARSVARRGRLTAALTAAACCVLFALAMEFSAFYVNRPGHTNVATWIPGPVLSEEGMWGFDWMKNHSPLVRVTAVLLVLLVAVPEVNRRLRRTTLALAVEFRQALGRHVNVVVPVALALTGWWLREARFSGDGGATADILLHDREWMNWKEPLDRLITVVVYRLLRRTGDCSPEAAIALVSCVAGVAYWAALMASARLVADDHQRRLATFLLLSCAGVTQLFFGHVENYSLLGAGIAVYLFLGMRFLRLGKGLTAAAWVLGLTICIHLSAVWLLPTLGVLVVLYLEDYRQRGGWPLWRVPRDKVVTLFRQAGAGAAGMAVVGAATIALGLRLIGDAHGLSAANFGGGDGKMFMSFVYPSTAYEKYTVLSMPHVLATANLILLLCPTAAVLVLAYLSMTPRRERVYGKLIVFVGSAALCCLAYVFFFNPDMAIFDVGVLNEWDLFSLPAYPLALLGAQLWLKWEPVAERQAYVATLLVCTGAIHAGAFILGNAGVFL